MARGGQFIEIPEQYPESAWYSYTDPSCNYMCMITEYMYWGLTSILGAQANPIQDLAAVIGVGGKATIFMPVDSLNNLPANIMAMDYITYNMEITKVETEEEYQAEIQRIKDKF